MKMICVPSHFRSFGAALAIVGLQFSSAVLPSAHAQAQPNFFDWENLQTDVPGVADRTDAHLVNPWGLTINTKANIFWLSDNNADVSTLYQPDGTPIPLVVSIPQGAPTGIVFNSIPNAFILSQDGQPAAFIFDSENGSITAWNGGLQPITKAVIKFDNSDSGAVYKGLAMAVRKNGEPTLYTANFNKGTVDVFDNHFVPEKLAGNFVDPNPPPVPKGTFGWAPFDLASIEGNIYVTFAAQNQKKHDDLAGPGRGFVDIFDTEGHLLKRLITGGHLNSPWGLAKVPEHEHFGKFDDEVLLVGNFGDGQINAYDVHSGAFIATLLRRTENRTDQPLQFNGLWSLFFFGGKLYFTAGIVDEAHGLFGFIHPAEQENSDD
jgi:uncharacterized protein (TIGR03118 family)